MISSFYEETTHKKQAVRFFCRKLAMFFKNMFSHGNYRRIMAELKTKSIQQYCDHEKAILRLLLKIDN